MKRLLPFENKIGQNGILRAILASGLAIIMGFSIGVATAWAEGNGQCPRFDADLVDAKFLEWSEAAGFDPNFHSLRYVDPSATPYVVFDAFVEQNITFFRALVAADNSTAYDAVGNLAYTDNWELWSHHDDNSVYLTTAEAHQCQAEILRSATWREYCKGNVFRP